MAIMTNGERAHFGGRYPEQWKVMDYVRQQRRIFNVESISNAVFGSQGNELTIKAIDAFMHKVYPKSITEEPGVYIPSIIEDGGTYAED